MKQTQIKKYSYLDEFKIIKTLGSGYHAQVKLAMDETGKLYAIKRYKKQTASLKTLHHQLDIMKALQHQNLVRLYDVRENAIYKRKDQTTYKCFAIVLEYVGGGQLFDFVAETGRFSQKVTRTYFHQLMNGLYYMHCKGYAHRDIKPENILLSGQFTLKLADFGFTCFIKGKDGSGILHTKLGTQGYMAPEIPSKNYKGNQADIFASGVILFIMYAGNPPFQKASINDPYYRLIKEKNYETFWKAHSRNRSNPNNFFNPLFKDLFAKMVAFEPSQRPTIEQIASNPWVLGPICKLSQIKQQFQLRKKRLDFIMDKKREQQQKQKQAISNSTNLNHLRGSQIQINGDLASVYQKQIQTMRKLTHLQAKNTDDFQVDENFSYAIASLNYFFENKKIVLSDQQDCLISNPMVMKAIQVAQNQNSFHVTYQYCIELGRDVFKRNIEIVVKFGQTSDQKLAICIEHCSGNRLYYKMITKQLKNLFSYCMK